MNEQEILAEAKRRFPIGTVFNEVSDSIIAELKIIVDDDLSEPKKWGWLSKNHLIIYCKDRKGNRIKGKGFYIYKDGKYATIISRPNNNIEIW
jgi:hypothetical protein